MEDISKSTIQLDYLTPVSGFNNFLWAAPHDTEQTCRENCAFVLFCIATLFKLYIPTIDANGVTILISPHFDTPQCFHNPNHIHLSTKPDRWSQITYQFSHELCHHAIHGDVAPNLRWLEESICEMASLYFMRLLTQLWQKIALDKTTTDGQPYAPLFTQYVQDAETKFTSFCLTDSEAIRALECDCYDRKRNMYVAKMLLPIFIKHPRTWLAVPHLAGIQQPSLLQAIDAWIHESPADAHQGLQALRTLFATPGY